MTNFNRQRPALQFKQWTRLGVRLICTLVIASVTTVAQASEVDPGLQDKDSQQAQPDALVRETLDHPESDSQEKLRFNLLRAADQLYQTGRKTEATLLYKKAKQADERPVSAQSRPEPTFDVKSGAVKVYWREANAGFEQGLESKIMVPLTLLAEKNPEFIPGHLKLAEGHNQFNRSEEALAALERGASMYPNVPELQVALMNQQARMMRWLPAAITARQFATLNPDHARAAEFLALSERYQRKFRATLRENMTSNAIGSVFTGALNLGLTGNPFGALSPIQNAIALLRGEEPVGRSAAKSYRKKLPMLEDEAVNAYVNRIGQKLTAVAGREMNYEFYVVNDERLNAFALPGGKIFVHSGAILKSRSEAELAGLLAHELSHSVLSHGFQMYTRSNATGSFTQLIPFGGLFSRVAVTKYSRDLEQQADLLGTRMLASAGYAADGLENLSQIILQEETNRPRFSWLSTHPDTEDRIQYLGDLIDQNGYNRYAYEGVSEHAEIQALVQSELDKLQEDDDEDALPLETQLNDDAIAE